MQTIRRVVTRKAGADLLRLPDPI